MDEITMITQVGFPIFVAVWLMIKGSKDSQKIAETLDRLALAIEGCPKRRRS